MQYQVTADITVSVRTVVEADSPAEAIEEAESREVVIGGTGSGAEVGEQWVIEDPDGEPQNIRFTE